MPPMIFRERQLLFRPVRPEDADAVIALIDGIYTEYGDRMCLERCDGDLLDIGRSYAGGRFMVLEDEGRVVGTVAVRPGDEPGTAVLKRMYLHADYRGSGVAAEMLAWARETAREMGKRRLEFWSDVRFTRAHAFYEKHGYTRGGIRAMDDAWEPYEEYFFEAELA